ncbi:MAG: tyrosine-type recombinase/integrase [Rivularia sp. (in: cyanobacteria)]
MSSKKLNGYSGRGSVQIKNSNGRLQIVFSHPVTTEAGELKTKRFYLSTRHDDTPLGRQQASIIAAKIQRDIDYGEFDATLAKYKPAASVETVAPKTRPSCPKKQDLEQLWEQYTEFKKPQISPSTYAVDYRKYRNHIANLPTKSLDDAVSIRDYLIANLTPNAAKRTLTNINACCNWAMKSKLIESNPFRGMAKDIQIPKSETTEYQINPFTPEERDAIIKAFEESKLYSYYAPLVKILFFTGCRPSEAIALQWKHITEKYITFEQAMTISNKGFAIKNGLKTQSQRRFPINNQLREILASIKPENNNPEEFIFKSKKGGIIDFGDFLNRAWKGYKNHRGKHMDGIVTKLVKQGVISEYRKPYQCRHTFITLCLEADIDAKDIGKWVGNSPEVIYKHYAGSKANLEVPEL